MAKKIIKKIKESLSLKKKASPAPKKVVQKSNHRKAREGTGLSQKELEQHRETLEKTAKPKHIIKGKATGRFDDVLKKAKESPSMYVPSDKELKALKKGNSIKVGIDGDLLWLTVKSISGDKIKGIVEHKLARTHIHGIDMEHEVDVETKNIYKIFKN